MVSTFKLDTFTIKIFTLHLLKIFQQETLYIENLVMKVMKRVFSKNFYLSASKLMLIIHPIYNLNLKRSRKWLILIQNNLRLKSFKTYLDKKLINDYVENYLIHGMKKKFCFLFEMCSYMVNKQEFWSQNK
jgi:hypothetical protein